jgi:hypothetical protein
MGFMRSRPLGAGSSRFRTGRAGQRSARCLRLQPSTASSFGASAASLPLSARARAWRPGLPDPQRQRLPRRKPVPTQFEPGGAAHLENVWRAGTLPLPAQPLAFNVYWTLLTVVDPVAAVLLVVRSRAGLLLAGAITASDVAVNAYAFRGAAVRVARALGKRERCVRLGPGQRRHGRTVAVSLRDAKRFRKAHA